MISKLRRPSGAAAMLAVLVVFIVGSLLAFQGWKARIPGFDFLLDIEGARGLLLQHQLPTVSSLNSFAAYNAPGGSWLILPGVLLFHDPRLYGVASLFLYAGTLAGVFLLTRTLFANYCAILATLLYGFSDLGLRVAESLWPRYPIQ